MSTKYDENLSENGFFRQFRDNYNDVLRRASENNWIICIPRVGTWCAEHLKKEDVLEHILVGNDTTQPHYHTLTHKEVNVRNNFLIIKTDGITNTIRILFTEIFYVGHYKYTVWCVDASLTEKCIGRAVDIIEINDFRDCIDLLWTDNLGYVALEKINVAVNLFLEDHQLNKLDLQEQTDLIKNLYEQCLHVALSCESLRNKTKDVTFFNNLQVAIETYMQTCLNKTLFNALYTYTSYSDANFNKIIRNVQDTPLKVFDIDPEFYDSLPLAKYEINKINRSYTTLDKLNCLKCTLNVLSSQNKSQPITAENLLQIFMFLIIKSSVYNWITNLIFIKEFRFSLKTSCDENNFLTTTLQAAIESIKTGELCTKYVGLDLDCQNKLRSLFHYICEGNLEKVSDALSLQNQSKGSNLKLCHPLCSCDKCETLLIENHTCEVNSCDERGFTPLHVACKSGYENIVDFLIQKGANIHSTDCSGSTPLHYAVSKGHQDATILLLHSWAIINAPDCEGNTPLHIAVRNGHENCVKTLIYSAISQNEICIDCANNFGDTPLHFAAKFGYIGLVKILIQHGARVKQNKRHLTPNDVAHNESVVALLTYALVEIPSVEELIEVSGRRCSLQESNITKKGSENNFCAHKGSTDIKRRASICVENDYKGSLCNFGSRPKTLDHFKKTDLLLKAIENNDLPLTCFYLGIPLPNVSSNIQTSCHPLCMCEKCDEQLVETDCVESLKDVDCLNINICNSEGFTPLHVAAKCGRSEMLRLLLDAGALINLKTYKTFYTPLHLACIYQRIQIVRELLKCGCCNVDVFDSKGNTPLHYACLKDDVRIFELLLSQGADVSVKNNCGRTVLNEAEHKMLFNIVKILKDQSSVKQTDIRSSDSL